VLFPIAAIQTSVELNPVNIGPVCVPVAYVPIAAPLKADIDAVAAELIVMLKFDVEDTVW